MTYQSTGKTIFNFYNSKDLILIIDWDIIKLPLCSEISAKNPVSVFKHEELKKIPACSFRLLIAFAN